jgi:cytoskeletal protein CcmA (bactofilin family)
MSFFRPCVVINGEMNGHICGKGKVVINCGAIFFGTIKTEVLKTAGIIIGNIDSDRLIVKRTGKLYYRNIQYQSISLHNGGVCSSIKSIIEEQSDDQMVTKLYITQQMEKNRLLLKEQNLEENSIEYVDKVYNKVLDVSTCSKKNKILEEHSMLDNIEEQETPILNAKEVLEDSSMEETVMNEYDNKSNEEGKSSEQIILKEYNIATEHNCLFEKEYKKTDDSQEKFSDEKQCTDLRQNTKTSTSIRFINTF